MKNLLLTLSSISTLTLIGNAVLNSSFTQHRNVLQPSSGTKPVTSALPLLNNEYQKLNDSDWIINQATTDNKYYSYDTSHANYELSDKTSARNAFMVDDKGQLVIKTKATYTAVDYNNLNNTKDEIIAHRKVTAINRSPDNAYTGSEFLNNIFTGGDGSDWKFLQESQVEKHVNISDVAGANKVLDNDSLSEGLGLYYIGQAVVTDQSKEDLDTYIQLARAFMNRSSLGTNVPDKVLTGIINTFISASNNAALQYLSGVPFQNTGGNTNYATNYILNNNNQVVEIYYTQYTKQYNIKNLNLQFNPQVISVEKPEAKAVTDIESLIKQKMLDSFKNQLSDKVNIKPAQIDDKYFTLKFNNEDATENFNTQIDVSYTITTNWQAANQFNFAGTYDGTIPVINKCINLSAENNLKTVIENKYIKPEPANWLTVNINNPDNSNIDAKLTPDGLKSANNQIINIIKKDVSDYFQTNDSDIGIKDDDFTIATNLQEGDNLFNQQQGKTVAITITAVSGQYRISNSLSSINITVHGRNTNFINGTIQSDPNTKFALDGIHQLDHEDTDVLQDGNHKYDQPKLLTRLVGDLEDRNSQDSVLGTIKKNSYSVDATSFTGNVAISYVLEGEQTAKTVSIPIDKQAITNDVGSENNFWDVLTKTKTIWLQTTVVHTNNDRTLNSVSLVFTPSINPDDKPLCVLDLSNQFAGTSITNPATLAFPDFQFVINYQQMS